MPTNRRHRTRGQIAPVIERTKWGEFFLWHMGTANPFFDAWNGDEDAMRDYWETYRDDMFAEAVQRSPGCRPAVWWLWDAPEPIGEDESQFEYLERHGLLLEGEREAHAAGAAEMAAVALRLRTNREN